MVGLYGGEPLEYQAINEQGSDAVPASTGQVLGAAFGGGLGANLFPRLMRSTGRLASETGLLAVDEYGRQIIGEPDEQLDPEAANQQFGIKGVLSFDKPVAKSVAHDLYDHKREQVERDDAITRRAGGLTQGGAARFTASMAAGLLDPINLAVGLIPIVGEARVASLLGRGAIEAAGAAERAGVRVVAGGVSGAAQMAALQPLEFALSKQEHEDYTMADALRSIALGTVLGGGLHAGTGALIDRATGRYRNPVTQRLEEAGPEARETLLQGALAQTIEGRPVDVAPALDAVEAAPAQPKFTFEREVRQAGPIARETNNYLIRNASGDHVASAHITFDESGSSAHIQYIDAPAEGEFGRVLGPSTMREIGRAFFQTYPEAQQLSGERVSGARLARDMNNLGDAETVTVTREQLLRERRTATEALVSSTKREPAPDPAATVDVDRAAAQPRDTLQEIQKQAEDLERVRAPDTASEGRAAQDAPAAAEAASTGEQARPAPPSEAQVAADLAESRASAIERAAACITRG